MVVLPVSSALRQSWRRVNLNECESEAKEALARKLPLLQAQPQGRFTHVPLCWLFGCNYTLEWELSEIAKKVKTPPTRKRWMFHKKVNIQARNVLSCLFLYLSISLTVCVCAHARNCRCILWVCAPFPELYLHYHRKINKSKFMFLSVEIADFVFQMPKILNVEKGKI